MTDIDRITIDPAIRGGKPCIKGTRIPVYDLLEYLAGGMTEEQILVDFPSLVLRDIRAVLAFAAIRERRLASPTAWSFSSTRISVVGWWSWSRQLTQIALIQTLLTCVAHPIATCGSTPKRNGWSSYRRTTTSGREPF